MNQGPFEVVVFWVLNSCHRKWNNFSDLLSGLMIRRFASGRNFLIVSMLSMLQVVATLNTSKKGNKSCLDEPCTQWRQWLQSHHYERSKEILTGQYCALIDDTWHQQLAAITVGTKTEEFDNMAKGSVFLFFSFFNRCKFLKKTKKKKKVLLTCNWGEIRWGVLKCGVTW